MKLRYFSDLHLEFIKPHNINKFIEQIPIGIDEICILAGDIGNPYQSNWDTFFEFISKNMIILAFLIIIITFIIIIVL